MIGVDLPRSTDAATRAARGRPGARRLLAGALAAGAIGLSAASAAAFSLFDGDGWDGPGRGRADLAFHFGSTDPFIWIDNEPVALTSRTPDLTADAQRSAFATAMGAWASVAAVTFTEAPVAGRPESIDISFGVAPTPSLLAFGAGPPPLFVEPTAGDVFFNDDVRWEVGDAARFEAFDLTLVAAHEIGHALGLGHSDVFESVMYPFVSAGEVFTALDPDDVAGIRSIYAESLVAVPQASTLALVGSGLIGLGVARWRRRKR